MNRGTLVLRPRMLRTRLDPTLAHCDRAAPPPDARVVAATLSAAACASSLLIGGSGRWAGPTRVLWSNHGISRWRRHQRGGRAAGCLTNAVAVVQSCLELPARARTLSSAASHQGRPRVGAGQRAAAAKRPRDARCRGGAKSSFHTARPCTANLFFATLYACRATARSSRTSCRRCT